jgi:transcriptional regulator with XRE-family HTH domain
VAQASAVIDVLKRELKARGLTYAVIAERIGMSEPSIKRMFSQRNFTLERLDEICTAAGIEFTDLARGFDREQHLISRLTEKQESEIVTDAQLFLVAVCVLNHLSFDDILAAYALSEAELVGLLMKLHKMEIIELLPNNRFKLRIARTFAWQPNGPIQKSFKRNADDFFDSAFAAPDELMLLLNARLSRASRAQLVDKLRRLAREFSDQHLEDSHLPLADRAPMSLLLACRPWHPRFMRGHVKQKAAAAPSRRVPLR